MADTAAAPGVPPGSAPADRLPPAAGERRESLIGMGMSLLRDLPGLLSDRVELLALELRRAGLALVQILVLVVAAAILAVTAWLALWAGVVGGLMALGLHWAAALMVVLLLNVVAAALALLRVSKLLPLLQLPATRRHLSLSPSIKPPPPQPVPPVTATSTHEHTAAAPS